MISLQDEASLGTAAVESVAGRRSDIALICEHAGFAIPRPWGSLGLPPELLATHFAGDLGARETALALARTLDAPLVLAAYSRLFCDINRTADDWECFRVDMGGIPVPGNLDLSREERAARERISREPFYHRARSIAAGCSLLVSVHSFSPVHNGKLHATEIGVMHRKDCMVADMVVADLRAAGVGQIGDNEPYDLTTTPPGTLDLLRLEGAISPLAIEIRNDLAQNPDRREEIVAALSRALEVAMAKKHEVS